MGLRLRNHRRAYQICALGIARLALCAWAAAAQPIRRSSLVPAISAWSTIIPHEWLDVSGIIALCILACVAILLSIRLQVQWRQRQKDQLEHAVRRRTEELEREKQELRSAGDQLRHFAEHDGLTGLWNHRVIIERLRNEIDRSQREGTPIGIILADLDHFKRINDTHGHQAGDLVLKEISDVFLRAVRSYDWVGRYGGEEFLLILPGTGFAASRARAEQLREAVQAMSVQFGGSEIPVTSSFGVAAGFPANYEIMLQAADSALYRAKANGRNCVICTEVQPSEKRNPGE